MGTDATDFPTRPTLLRRIRDAQDQEAWSTFVDIYTALVFRYARKMGLEDADAKDVTQEVLFQVSRSIRAFDYQPEKGRFRDWLYKVTRRKIHRFRKKQAGQTLGASDLDSEDNLSNVGGVELDPDWLEAYQRRLLEVALERVLPQFEESTQRAFALQWLQDRSAAQAARELSLSVGAVYTAKCRVLKRLEEEIRELGEDAPWFQS